MTLSDLPRVGRAYIAVVAVFGSATLAHSIYSLFAQPIGRNWFVLAALTLVTGSATVKLPSVPATISISETFVFTATLLYGPAAGTLTVALDALVISYSLARRGHPAYRILFNICALPASLWVGAQVFFWVADIPPLAFVAVDQKIPLEELITPLVLFTTCYFGLNSWLIAVAISIERAVPAARVWRENFAWLALNYFGGASVAALLVTYTRDLDYAFLAIVVPLLAVLYFTFSTALGRIEDTNRHLTKLNSLYMSTIETLAMAIDAKDQITHGHIRRVQHYAVGLAKRIGVFDATQISAIEAASLLHDMGKLAVPEYILNKPGPLSTAEFEKMKLHASVGADILSAIEFPYPVVPIVRHHHENWDGSGYPDGLKGTNIPIGARVLSVVDCFDALTSDRPYRPRLSDEEAIRILIDRRGTMYDPVIVDTFIAIHEELWRSADNSKDHTRDELEVISRHLKRVDTPGNHSVARLAEINASTGETLTLFELAMSLLRMTNFAEAAEAISSHLRRLVPAATCVIYRFDENSDEIVSVHSSGHHSAHFAGLRIPRGQRLSGWIAANLQSVLNSDPVLDIGETARSLKPPLRSYAGAALHEGTRLLGVLAVYSTETRAFSDEHQRIIEAVARQVAPALAMMERPRNARSGANEELPQVEQLERFLATQLATSDAHPTSIIEVSLPTTGGRASLHSVIGKTIATTVRQSLRPSDFLFQNRELGFVCLLTDADETVAEHIAAQVRERLVELGGILGSTRIAISVATATAPQDGVSLRALLDRVKSRHQVSTRPSSIH